MGQEDENDNNKNRKYKILDRKISRDLCAKSAASSTTKLNNAYVKAIDGRQIGSEKKELSLVTNNGFIRKRVFDGMRQAFLSEFTAIYILISVAMYVTIQNCLAQRTTCSEFNPE